MKWLREALGWLRRLLNKAHGAGYIPQQHHGPEFDKDANVRGPGSK